MIEYSFIGVKDFNRIGVISKYDETNGDISAETTSGAMPLLQYDSYFPNYSSGYLVARKWISGVLHELFFSSIYPFLTVQTSIIPDPGYTDLTIDSLTVTGTSAIGVNDGAVLINVSGGTGTKEYSLDGINWYPGNYLNGLPAQGYTAFVRDDSNFYGTGHFIIDLIVPPPPIPLPIIKDIIALSDSEIEIQNAYKRVKVLSKFGQAPSVISNGDFEVYDGQNWDFWTKYGNINVSRIQRTVTNSLGVQVPIENYALRFNEKSQQSRYLEHDAIPVQKGDTLKIDYRVGKTPGTGASKGDYLVSGTQYIVLATYSTYYLSKIRIKCGNFYLYNADYGNSYVWVNQVATVSHRIDNPQGDLSNYLVNFNIPECPVTSGLIIQLYGFQKVQDITTEEYKPTPFVTIPPLFFTNELNEYSPIDVDNISASKSSQNSDNDIEGILSISDNLRFYSQVPETKEILFGDLFYRKDYQQPLDNLYAIKYNGKYTTGWYEYLGGSSKTVPFGMGLAKSILTAYQKPFRKWSGNLLLTDTATRGFSYLDIVSFNVPNSPSFSRKQFAFLGGQINLKTRQFENISLVEIFDKDARSNDNTVPAYPNMPDPVFEQDPNSTIGNGIFTSEFTQEFN